MTATTTHLNPHEWHDVHGAHVCWICGQTRPPGAAYPTLGCVPDGDGDAA